MSKGSPKLNLSKSLYTKGLQCQKALWLKKYRPEVLTPPDAQLQAVFDTGNVVGDLACDLFPNGKEVPFEGTTFSEKTALTQQWLDEGLVNIYEATFEYDGILVRVDILHRCNDGSFKIYEVKSSTKVKDVFIHDASIQYYVLNGLGYSISDVYVTILNINYIRGDELDIKQLFTHAKVTDDVLALQDDIPSILERFRETLTDRMTEPNIDIGWHCRHPYDCDAMDYCWKQQRNIPEYSVFNIFSLTKNSKSMQLYKGGITAVEDIPDDCKLTDIQQIYVDVWKCQKGNVNRSAIRNFISTISYPIYHFDFETLGPAIPEFEGMKPYTKYPFQYSLHIEQEIGSLEHKEYLATPGQDPREEISRRITEDIPKDACIMAFNISFEKSIIRALAKCYPEYEDHLMNVYDNFIDLATPFKSRDFYFPEMQGHYGLKSVLPAVVPEMKNAYNDLGGVHCGDDAMLVYNKLREEGDLNEISQIKDALLEYCKLDTYAMVKILERLKKLAS